jgi:hypothetical protein
VTLLRAKEWRDEARRSRGPRCSRLDMTKEETVRTSRRSTFLAAAAALAVLAAGAFAAAAPAEPPWGPETPNFNLEAILRPSVGDSGFGHVKFRQPNDADKTVYLGTWVRDLAPNHGYYLRRATDPNVNDDCSGTNWVNLGQGPVPQVITTDETGTGRADLWRSLATVPLGTELDIYFQVIDAVTSAVVLESACYQFTVSL